MSVVDFDTLTKGLLDNDLKDFKIKAMVDGKETDLSLADFMDDAKGYGEVARGNVAISTAIASSLIQKALAPLQERLAAYEQKEAQAQADTAHSDFISKVASETAHKDVAEIEKSPELWNWMKTQTPQMQALGASEDTRDIDLLLSAFKAATGYKSSPATTNKPSRQELVDKQRADLQKADKIARSTMRSRNAAPSSESDEGAIETTEDAEKEFAAAAAKLAANNQ